MRTRDFAVWLFDGLFASLTRYMGACGFILYDSGGGGGYSGPSVGQIADAVWDEPLNSHTSAGSTGAFMRRLLTVSKFIGLK